MDLLLFVEQVLKNNITTIFPMCIALITGYIISREGTDDTLKNILTVPCPFPLCWLASWLSAGCSPLFLGIVSTVFTVTASFLLGFPRRRFSGSHAGRVADHGQLPVPLYRGSANHRHRRPHSKRALDWSGDSLCLRLRRDCCGGEHDLGEFVSRDRKHGADWIPQL